MGVAPLTTIRSDPLAKFLLSVCMTLWSASLKVLVPGGIMLPPRHETVIPLNWKLRLPPSHFGLLRPLNQQAKGVATLAGVNDPYYQGKLDYYSTMEVRKAMSGVQEMP